MAEKCASCAAKTAHHKSEIKTELSKRLNRIEGQIRGVKKMIEDDVYCDDALNQIASVQAAINGVRVLLLENHIKTCVVEQLQNGEVGVVDELVKTIRRMTS